MSHDFPAPTSRFSLSSLGLLDGPGDTAFEFIVQSVSAFLRVPVCLISIIDDARNRQHFLASVGLPRNVCEARETPLSHSICRHVRDAYVPLKFSDTEQSPVLQGNLAARDLNAKSYIGVPILGPNNDAIGSLCAIDHIPRIWSEHELGYLEGFSDLVNRQIAFRAALATIKLMTQDLIHD